MTPRTMSRFTGAFPPALIGIARGGPWTLAHTINDFRAAPARR